MASVFAGVRLAGTYSMGQLGGRSATHTMAGTQTVWRDVRIQALRQGSH